MRTSSSTGPEPASNSAHAAASPAVTSDASRAVASADSATGESRSSAEGAHPQHAAPEAMSARDRSVIMLLLVSAFVVILNETILSVALPPIMDDLGIVETTAQWLTTGFMLTMAVVIPITGYLMGRFSTRQVFTAAMTAFTVGTVICALAPSFVPLLAGRIVQATGPAIMMPLLMTTVMNLVPANRRGRVMGNISIVISVAPALGPTISGLILAFAPWRMLFVLVAPIAVGALILGLRRIENVNETTDSPADPLSVMLSAIGFGTLVYGLTGIGGGGHGATDAGGAGQAVDPAADATLLGLPVTSVVCLAIGVLALTAFVLRQLSLQKRDRALLDLRTFAHRNFTVAVVLMMVMMAAMFGTVVLLPIFLQRVLELSTLTVGLMMLPGGLVMGLAAPFVGRLFDRVGPRPLLTPGLVLVVAGVFVLSRVGLDSTPALIVAGHLTMSVGLALVFTPLFTTALGSLPKPLYGHGSAIVGTVQQVAGATGAAVMVALMSRVAAGVAADGGTELEGIAQGTSLAFLASAGLGVITIVISVFIRRNPDSAA